MLFNGARIVGPAAAGLLIANLGIASALFLNAVSFIAVIAGLLLMDPRMFLGCQGRERLGGPAPAGGPALCLAHARRAAHDDLMAAIGTFGYNFSVVLPLVAGFVLHTDAAGFGGLSAFLGIGSLVAALTTAYTRQVTPRRLILGATTLASCSPGWRPRPTSR